MALSGCATAPTSSLDYDWYYNSEIEEKFDKFEGIITISISPTDVSKSEESFGNPLDEAKISFYYHYKESLTPSFAYFMIIKDSYITQLENSEFKFETNGQFHKGELSSYKKHPRQVGSASIGTYRGSYNESTRFAEVANYKFEVSDICPFNRQSAFEFKAGEIYKLSQGYSVSLEKWCDRVSTAIRSTQQTPTGSHP